MPRRRTEILVHIAAPSKASDDARYRELAAAYLDFTPTAHRDLDSFKEPASGSQPVPSASSRPLESPQASFNSVLDNSESPRVVGKKRTYEESQSSWVAPPSVIADSNPENDVSIAAYCSPTRVLEHYLQAVEGSSVSSQEVRPRSHDTQPSDKINSSGSLQPDVRSSQATGGVSSFQEVARTSSNPARLPAAEEARKGPSGTTSGVSELTVPSSEASIASDTSEVIVPQTPRADSEPPLSKKPKRNPLKENVQALARSASDVLPRGSHIPPSASEVRLPGTQQWQDALEIHSPEPLVSIEDLEPESLITWKLAKIAKDLNLKKRFRPARQARDLRPLERGYWFLDCASWDQPTKQVAWRFLRKYVGNGDGGWGLWCQRDEDFTWIRLYCWGCVVGHTYLVLYLASQHKIKQQECSWHGGNGEVLLVVGPRT